MNVFTRYFRCLVMLSAALLLAACSDSREPEVPEVDILSRFNAEGKAWLSLEINLPEKSSMTRTTFDDGDDNEYAVNNMKLVLFRGSSSATEDELTVASTYNVTYSPDPDGHTQITNHSKVTIQITDNSIRTSDKLYLLVIANASPAIAENATFSTVKNIVLTTASGTTPMTTKVYDPESESETEYFVMTNAPLASANNGTGTVTTLVNVPASFFFKTEEEAEANPAAQIFLERAAAKVTVTESVSNPKKVLGNSYIEFETSDMAYAIDNYNTSSYLTRHFNSTWLPYNAASKGYRMVESAALPSTVYRTYWAQDANYDNVPGTNSTPALTFKAHAQRADITWKEMGSSSYCAENTFDVEHMQDDCTTSVLVRLQLNNGLDFYTTSVTGQDIIFQLPSNTLSEEGTSASESFAPRRSNKVTYDGTNYATINDYLRTWLMQNSSAFRTWVNTYAAGEPKHVNIAVSTPAGGGTATVTDVTQTARSSGTTGATAFNTLETTGLADYINNNVTLKFYDDGYCYYRVPIRHFTDTETPWSSISSMTNNTTTQAYSADAATAVGGSSADAAFLGRYGMVRNNWYTINITSVTHVGYPTIPALTSNADDTIEQLLNATLSISGWEDKSQNLN